MDHLVESKTQKLIIDFNLGNILFKIIQYLDLLKSSHDLEQDQLIYVRFLLEKLSYAILFKTLVLKSYPVMGY